MLGTLPAMVDAAGFDARTRDEYRPRAGCRAYPAYLAWLALNADPAAVVLAVTANFAAWGWGLIGVASSFLDFDHVLSVA